MAVFDNLKNFIRQGKLASAKSQQSKRRESVDSNNKRNRSATPVADVSTDGSSFQPTVSHHSQKSLTLASQFSTVAPSTDTTGNSTSATSLNHSASKSSGSKKTRNYDNAVKQIIAEENESRSKMPSYAGLEQYRLIEKMGDGAFSVVYKAEDRQTGEKWAIKVVSKHNITTSQRTSVLKEAAIMRQLNHPRIVHMHAFMDTPEHYFIVLELVPGGELFHRIVQLTYFSEDLSRHVILQVAQAVRYLHEEAGVVHRDIKPENLLFTDVPMIPSKKQVLRPGDDDTKEDEGVFTASVGGGGVGEIKLADFGLSKIIWDSKTMTPCGTVGYTAPEIVKDEKYSKSVDMWALGCVLYTVLCGFPPFYDESIEVLTHKVAMGQYAFLSPWWDGISDSAKDLVSRLLTVDPETRYTIDEFLEHPWITQSNERTPLSREVASHAGPSNASVPSTPMHERGARSGALKDAFDVSNAVYRLEQEIARRNQKSKKPAILEEDEDEENTEFAHIEHAFDKVSLNSNSNRDSSEGSSRGMTTAKSNGVGSQRAAAKRVAAAAAAAANGPGGLSSAASGNSSFFDLHLEGSTLLERRKGRQTPVAN